MVWEKPRIALVMSRLRQDEKLLLAALEARGCSFVKLDDRELVFSLERVETVGDVYLLRSISQSRTLYAAKILEGWGIKAVNPYSVTAACNDKVVTSSLLIQAGIPSPRTRIAFTTEAALEAMEELGYPVVLKPVMGSWGRLVARINDRDAAEAVLEDRRTLGSYHHSIFYVQEHIDKPGRDIRAIVVGDQVVAAMYRCSEHWLTNAARGSHCINCPLTPELTELALAAAQAVGGGVLAVDLLESAEGLLVNEINSTMEFKACTEATGVDIAGCVIDYTLKVARK